MTSESEDYDNWRCAMAYRAQLNHPLGHVNSEAEDVDDWLALTNFTVPKQKDERRLSARLRQRKDVKQKKIVGVGKK